MHCEQRARAPCRVALSFAGDGDRRAQSNIGGVGAIHRQLRIVQLLDIAESGSDRVARSDRLDLHGAAHAECGWRPLDLVAEVLDVGNNFFDRFGDGTTVVVVPVLITLRSAAGVSRWVGSGECLVGDTVALLTFGQEAQGSLEG
jgi:hypothetical protein